MWNFHQGIPSFHMLDFYIVFIGKIKTRTNRYVRRQHLFVIANDMQLKINIPEANEILTTAPHPAVATIVSLRYIRKFEPTYGTLWIRNFHYATANLPTSHQTSVTFDYAMETSVATSFTKVRKGLCNTPLIYPWHFIGPYFIILMGLFDLVWAETLIPKGPKTCVCVLNYFLWHS